MDKKWTKNGQKDGETTPQIRPKYAPNTPQIRPKSDTKYRKNWIIQHIKSTGQVRNGDIIAQFKIHKDTARRDLNKLLNEGKINRKGGGRNVWYELKQ